ncbi:MAG TPA: hypothetical protein VG826_32020 [Pirellulales bacterium]|nr:hypothetical protein [Pirellulales bacterium]
MAQVQNLPTELTLSDLHEFFGPMPAGRIPTMPPPGTATEANIIYLDEHEDRSCEPVHGVVLDENDTLTGGDVLPGFTSSLRDFFADPREGGQSSTAAQAS